MSFLKSTVYYCRDYTDTDVMAPGRYDPIEGAENLASIALIDYKGPEPFVDPETNRCKHQIIVAGRDFGCGSSRETATLGLYHSGVRVIVAKSFARIFFRNCINMGGLLPIQIDHDLDESIHGKSASIDFKERKFEIEGRVFEYGSFGPLEQIIQAGGLDSYTIDRLER